MLRYILYACNIVIKEIISCVYNTNLFVIIICFLAFIFVSFAFNRYFLKISSIMFIIVFSIYFTFLLVLTIFGRPTGQISSVHTLFYSFRQIVCGGRWGFFPAFLNVLLFVPYGFMVSYYYKMKTKYSFISLILLPLVIEITQLITTRGVFEISDIISNFIGGLIGFVFLNMIFCAYKIGKK